MQNSTTHITPALVALLLTACGGDTSPVIPEHSWSLDAQALVDRVSYNESDPRYAYAEISPGVAGSCVRVHKIRAGGERLFLNGQTLRFSYEFGEAGLVRGEEEGCEVCERVEVVYGRHELPRRLTVRHEYHRSIYEYEWASTADRLAKAVHTSSVTPVEASETYTDVARTMFDYELGRLHSSQTTTQRVAPEAQDEVVVPSRSNDYEVNPLGTSTGRTVWDEFGRVSAEQYLVFGVLEYERRPHAQGTELFATLTEPNEPQRTGMVSIVIDAQQRIVRTAVINPWQEDTREATWRWQGDQLREIQVTGAQGEYPIDETITFEGDACRAPNLNRGVVRWAHFPQHMLLQPPR